MNREAGKWYYRYNSISLRSLAKLECQAMLLRSNLEPMCLLNMSNVWHDRCKVACKEREYRQLWQSIHRGWEWIRNDLRTRLRNKWLLIYVHVHTNTHTRSQSSSHSAPSSSSSSTACITEGKSVSKAAGSIDRNYEAFHTCKESAAYVRAIRNEAEELKESLRASCTLRKALRKLTSINWILCYER